MPMPNSIYAVYDEEDSGLCVAVGNLREVSRFTGLTPQQVVGRAHLVKKRVANGGSESGRCRFTIVKMEGEV